MRAERLTSRARALVAFVAFVVLGCSSSFARAAPAIGAPPAAATCVGAKDPGTMRAQLLGNYDKYTAALGANGAASVNASMKLYTVLALNEAAGTVDVIVTTTLAWTDGRLEFNTTRKNNGCLGIPVLYFDGTDLTSSIWSPLVQFANSYSSMRMEPSEIMIASDGAVTTVSRARLSAACDFDFRKMPFDTQSCAIRLQMLSPSGMAQFVVDTSTAFSSDSDRLGGTKAWRVTQQSTTVGATASDKRYVDFEMSIKREPSYWVTFIMVPSILLVFMSYGTFWIQRSIMPARATFAFICYLTMISLTNSALSVLPKIAASDAFLLNLLLVSQYFSAFTVFETVVANYFLHIELRVDKAWKEAEKMEGFLDRSETMNMREHIVPKVAKIDRFLIDRHGKMIFSDQHVDVTARIVFPIAYVIALAATVGTAFS